MDSNGVMYKRKIESLLQQWKEKPKRKPLIIKGVRQCGKTSSVQEFAEKTTSTVLKHPEKYHVQHAIKIGDYNVGRDGALLTIPFYMAFLLTVFFFQALHIVYLVLNSRTKNARY